MIFLLIGDVPSKFIESMLSILVTSKKSNENIIINHHFFNENDNTLEIKAKIKYFSAMFSLVYNKSNVIKFNQFKVSGELCKDDTENINNQISLNEELLANFSKSYKDQDDIDDLNEIKFSNNYRILLHQISTNLTVDSFDSQMFVFFQPELDIFTNVHFLSELYQIFSKIELMIYVDLNFLDTLLEQRIVFEKYIQHQALVYKNVYMFTNLITKNDFKPSKELLVTCSINNAILTFINSIENKNELSNNSNRCYVYRSFAKNVSLKELGNTGKNILRFTYYIFFLNYLFIYPGTVTYYLNSSVNYSKDYSDNYYFLGNWLGWLKRTQITNKLFDLNFVNLENMFLKIRKNELHNVTNINTKCYVSDTIFDEDKNLISSFSNKYLYYCIHHHLRKYFVESNSNLGRVFYLYGYFKKGLKEIFNPFMFNGEK